VVASEEVAENINVRESNTRRFKIHHKNERMRYVFFKDPYDNFHVQDEEVKKFEALGNMDALDCFSNGFDYGCVFYENMSALKEKMLENDPYIGFVQPSAHSRT
jgi:hypothetical protein